jgi:hypothetical protein
MMVIRIEKFITFWAIGKSNLSVTSFLYTLFQKTVNRRLPNGTMAQGFSDFISTQRSPRVL